MNKCNSNLLKQCLTLALASGLWGSAFAAQPAPDAAGKTAAGKSAVPAKAGPVNAKLTAGNKPTMGSTKMEGKDNGGGNDDAPSNGPTPTKPDTDPSPQPGDKSKGMNSKQTNAGIIVQGGMTAKAPAKAAAPVAAPAAKAQK